MKPEHLALCVECDEVHPSHLIAFPDCGCSSAVPLSRITQGRRERDHLRSSPDWPYSLGPKPPWKEAP